MEALRTLQEELRSPSGGTISNQEGLNTFISDQRITELIRKIQGQIRSARSDSLAAPIRAPGFASRIQLD
jgi:hypothetical protein